MKKFILLIGILICLCGCVEQPAIIEKQTEESTLNHFRIIRHFEYKNHKYISFERGYGQESKMGIVHDPDCYCE